MVGEKTMSEQMLIWKLKVDNYPMQRTDTFAIIY
jgi:hypothetical protein